MKKKEDRSILEFLDKQFDGYIREICHKEVGNMSVTVTDEDLEPAKMRLYNMLHTDLKKCIDRLDEKFIKIYNDLEKKFKKVSKVSPNGEELAFLKYEIGLLKKDIVFLAGEDKDSMRSLGNEALHFNTAMHDIGSSSRRV